MGRVEETAEITRAIEEGTISNFKRAFWSKASQEMSGAIQIEIAKSLAQLADDIHFIKEVMAKEIEGGESVAVKYVKAAEDLRFFRKKDEEAPTHTCKNCVHYRRKLTRSYNYIFHWCDHQDCSISECGLNHPCDDFEEAES